MDVDPISFEERDLRLSLLQMQPTSYGMIYHCQWCVDSLSVSECSGKRTSAERIIS